MWDNGFIGNHYSNFDEPMKVVLMLIEIISVTQVTLFLVIHLKIHMNVRLCVISGVEFPTFSGLKKSPVDNLGYNSQDWRL